MMFGDGLLMLCDRLCSVGYLYLFDLDFSVPCGCYSLCSLTDADNLNHSGFLFPLPKARMRARYLKSPFIRSIVPDSSRPSLYDGTSLWVLTIWQQHHKGLYSIHIN